MTRQGFDIILEQSQKLVMTPELIQAIKILQFTNAELREYVLQELLSNPILDVADRDAENGTDNSDEKVHEEADFDDRKLKVAATRDDNMDWTEHILEKGYDDVSYRQFSENRSIIPDYSLEQYVALEQTLSSVLKDQLYGMKVPSMLVKISEYIIDGLDQNGYLTQNADEISASTGVSVKDINKAISLIQGMDPAGVGARDLKDCLKIQIIRKIKDSDPYIKIIENHLEDLAANRMAVIAKALSVSVSEAQKYCDVIRSLEPKPGRQYGSSQSNRYLPADVVVEKIGDEYVVSLNEKATPLLKVSPYYRKVLLENPDDVQAADYINNKINSATRLIRSIEQRKQTVQSVAEAIVNYQRDFLEKGVVGLKPLTLAQVASDLGIHESTVSRTVNGKYIQTPKGLFELRYFFTSGIENEEGEDVAAASIKSFIREMINSEDPKKPVSDQLISEKLKAEKGIEIARRTVAKYRESLNIASSSGRKRY